MSKHPATISLDVIRRANPSGGRPQHFVVEQLDMRLPGESQPRLMPYEWGPFSERAAHRQLRRVAVRRAAENTPDEVVTPSTAAPQPRLPDPYEPTPAPLRPLALLGRAVAPRLSYEARVLLTVGAATGLLAGVGSLVFAVSYLMSFLVLLPVAAVLATLLGTFWARR